MEQTWEILGRLFVAMICGMIIGLERERSGKPAGIRTTIMISMGSCLFASVSLLVSEFSGVVDISRIAAQVVSGIGFLGAGTIFKAGNDVQGLTTAATIWFVAAVGMLAGFGFAVLSLSASMLGLFVLIGIASLDASKGMK